MGEKKIALDRRDFLKGATVAGVGAAVMGLAGCSSPSSSQSSSGSSSGSSSDSKQENITVGSTETCDIVVCGAGASGISAAVKAAEDGAKVILLEKTSAFGGASLSCYSATVRNADDDITEMLNEWVADSHWRVDARVISNMLHKSGEAFNWLKNEWGWEFIDRVSFGQPQWVLPGDAAARTALYQNMLDKTGVDVRTGFTAKQLVQDDSGKITGVIAVDSKGEGTQFDCKAVAIATGGYAGNAEMVLEAFDFGGVCGGLPQNIGEGLEMAWAAGGKKPVNYGGQMLHQTLATATDTLATKFDDFPSKYPLMTTYIQQLMNVTAKGDRFRNEGIISSADAAANSSGYQGPFHWVVISGDMIKKLETGGMAALGCTAKLPIPPDMAPKYELDTPWTDATAVFDAAANGEDGFKGATYEELGEAAGMDPTEFANACKMYEGFCATGQDTELGKAAQYLVPMGAGPYYLVKAIQNNLSSWGGVATDINYQVLDDNLDPVPGLYAIGVESGGNMFNDTYMGVGIGVCLVFTSGYLTGTKMAEYVKTA